MLNQAALEELYSGTYLANYLKTMDSLPDDLQRQITLMKELDFQCRELLQEMENQQDVYKSEQSDAVTRKKALKTIQRCMIRSQEIGDEKLTVTSLIIELIENRSRQLDQDLENLDPSTNKEHDRQDETIVYPKKVESYPKKVESYPKKVDTYPKKVEAEKVVQKRQRRQKQDKDDDVRDEPEKSAKKRKRRVKKEKEEQNITSQFDNIDPDEPLYCLCDQVSYGEMIGCDYDGCEIEWFHFNCVDLYTKPKGKWFCPNCRGDKPSIKRSDLK